jgi:hypothetical protein
MKTKVLLFTLLIYSFFAYGAIDTIHSVISSTPVPKYPTRDLWANVNWTSIATATIALIGFFLSLYNTHIIRRNSKTKIKIIKVTLKYGVNTAVTLGFELKLSNQRNIPTNIDSSYILIGCKTKIPLRTVKNPQLDPYGQANYFVGLDTDFLRDKNLFKKEFINKRLKIIVVDDQQRKHPFCYTKKFNTLNTPFIQK